MTAKKMADIFFGKFSELISPVESSNKNDQATTKEIVEDRDQTKQKTQNQKILIYAGGFVVVAVLIYLFL